MDDANSTAGGRPLHDVLQPLGMSRQWRAPGLLEGGLWGCESDGCFWSEDSSKKDSKTPLRRQTRRLWREEQRRFERREESQSHTGAAARFERRCHVLAEVGLVQVQVDVGRVLALDAAAAGGQTVNRGMILHRGSSSMVNAYPAGGHTLLLTRVEDQHSQESQLASVSPCQSASASDFNIDLAT